MGATVEQVPNATAGAQAATPSHPSVGRVGITGGRVALHDAPPADGSLYQEDRSSH